MARRIVLTMVVLISVLLLTAVIPLGVVTTAREGDSFRADTAASARTLAAMAEETLTDHRNRTVLDGALARLQRSGEQAWIYGPAGQVVAGTGPADGAGQTGGPGQAAAAAVMRSGGTRLVETDDLLLAAVSERSVVPDGPDGAVVLSRSTGELDERVRVLWAWLIAVAAAVLVAGALVAVGFTRWVGRPLSALDVAAQRLGGGALDTRAKAGGGPPEVRRLASTFNTMAGRLETLVHGHQATMADVSHQLRTPLAALRLRLDLLSADATDHATASELAGAQDEIARLSRLVDGLLAVARAENLVVEPVLVAADAVIRDRAAAWRPVAEERGVSLATDCLDPAWARLGDGHLEQILDNLLANALDAVQAGGRIQVRARPAAGGVQVTVADDGPGMSPQQRAAAFRRFASTTPGGAGLGLAIVHRLATSNGGSAALADTPGGGLSVSLDLPGGTSDRQRRPGGPSA